MPAIQIQIEKGEHSAIPKNPAGFFVQVPVELLKSEVSSSALRLYLLLLSYGGPRATAWPGQSRLANDLQLSERRVRNLLTELEAAGLIRIEHVAGTSNLYHLHRFELRSLPGKGTATCEATSEQKCQGERNYSSTELHVLESKIVCEEKPQSKMNNEQKGVYLSLVTALEKELLKTEMNELVARELAVILANNGRDLEYIQTLITASQGKSIHNPIGFVRFMVLRNVEPICSSRLNARRKVEKTLPETTPPIDFSKYTTGKYAYLTERKSIPNLADPPNEVGAENYFDHIAIKVIDPKLENQNNYPVTVKAMPLLPTVEPINPAWAKPEHVALRRIIATSYGFQSEKLIKNWSELLSKLATQGWATYFYPTLGWLTTSPENSRQFNLIFRNKFDKRLSEPYLKQLIEFLTNNFGFGIELVCYDFV